MDKQYIFKTILSFLKKNQVLGNLEIDVQKIYNMYGFGYDVENDAQLIMSLQEFNQKQNVPYLASGQNGYFSEQIDKNGLTNLKLMSQDLEDAKFIANCFGRDINYQSNDVQITYTTLLGTTEFNYASQSFPAGIFEDVFQCSASHELPIQPKVGEKEQDFYIRLLNYQINSCSNFKTEYKEEVILRATRLINNFCKSNNRVYLIRMDDVLNIKASFGDVSGLRDGNLSPEDTTKKIESLISLDKLLESFNVNVESLYTDPNLSSEYGIALYGNISRDKLKYIEVQRAYNLMQKKALDMGLQLGEEILKYYDNLLR